MSIFWMVRNQMIGFECFHILNGWFQIPTVMINESFYTLLIKWSKPLLKPDLTVYVPSVAFIGLNAIFRIYSTMIVNHNGSLQHGIG